MTLRDWILERCPDTKSPMTKDQITCFLALLEEICKQQEDDPYGQSLLQQSAVDLSHWHEVQNLFHNYFTSEHAEM